MQAKSKYLNYIEGQEYAWKNVSRIAIGYIVVERYVT